jgi:hypothetical protein
MALLPASLVAQLVESAGTAARWCAPRGAVDDIAQEVLVVLVKAAEREPALAERLTNPRVANAFARTVAARRVGRLREREQHRHDAELRAGNDLAARSRAHDDTSDRAAARERGERLMARLRGAELSPAGRFAAFQILSGLPAAAAGRIFDLPPRTANRWRIAGMREIHALLNETD